MSTQAPKTRLRLRVQPRGARDRIVGWRGEALRVQVQAPPVDGAANGAVAGLLAAALAVPRRAVRLVGGIAGRDKVVEVDGLDAVECRRRLDAAATAR